MAIKKSELYSSLWKSCDELRGGMDASQYKDYVLVLLFVKYVSDKYAGQPQALIEVPEGGGFADMSALKGDKEIGDKINKIIARLAEANELKGVIDVADFNDPDKLGRGKEMVDRLSNLVAIFENPGLDFSKNRAEGDDILGDAYEYLMRHFATQSGKAKGQFYTPAEVSRIMAQVIGIRAATRPSQTIYDPTCGSGSLLLKAADEAPRGVTIYGQEMDNATAALAKMNMILHDHPTAEVWQDNTLSSPHFKNPDGSLKTFDFVVANPPFSNKAWRSGFDPENDLYGRFEDGIPPAKNGDYAFFLHLVRSLKSKGKGAIILPHGVLFRGNIEGEIRKNTIRRGYIKGIIGLPPNLFYGTGIPACIIVVDKENAAGRTGIFMIDASQGFAKDGPKNRLRHQDIRKIVSVFSNQTEVAKYARLVRHAEIEENDFNLNIPRYIDSTEPEDLQDIEAHLLGGLPNRDIDALARYWQVFPSLREELFEDSSRSDCSELKVPQAEIKATILEHEAFLAYRQAVQDVFDGWRVESQPRLEGLAIGDAPKQLIEELAENLLQAFLDVKLIDRYDVYQHLMSYWSETMQDDVYLIVADGWAAGNRFGPVGAKEQAEFLIGKQKLKGELLPAPMLVARYFAAEQKAIGKLEAGVDRESQQLAELVEEHGGEEGLLEEVTNDRGNITKGAVTKRIREIKDEAEFADELEVLTAYLDLVNKEAAAKKKAKAAKAKLDGRLAAKYGVLSKGEVNSLVVEEKWLATLAAEVQTELDRISQRLTARLEELVIRYARCLPDLVEEVRRLGEKVEVHLVTMGFKWN